MHPEKFISREQVMGNQKLLKEAGTIGIGNDADLHEYRKLIDRKHEELTRVDYVVMAQPSFLVEIR